MKKLLIAATALMTGFSLMADISPNAAAVRDALQGVLNARLEHLSTNLNFRAWNRLNQINRDFNTKLLNNEAFDKTVSTYFNQKVIDTITRLDPKNEADAALFEQGFRYTATVDFSDFGYTFTENADKTGFDVEESESGALEVLYTARSEDDLPPGGGEEPKTICHSISLQATGDTFELLVPARNNPALAIIVRVPQTLALSVAESMDGGEWMPAFASGVTWIVNKADPEAPYVNFVGDEWTVSGNFTMVPPKDATDPAISIELGLGQKPESNQATAQFSVMKGEEVAANLSMIVTNMSEEVKTFDFQKIESLADFATMALDDCSVSEFKFNLSDKVALTMSVDNCAETVRIQQKAKLLRYRGEDTQEKMQDVANELNEHVKCNVEIKLLGPDPLTVELELRAVKFGTDYVIVPAFQFDPDAGDDGWVALTDMVTQDAVAYAINIADHATEPARGAFTAAVQVMKYLGKLVSQRIAAESIVPATMAEGVSQHITQMMKLAAENANFSSWERINTLNQFFNANVLNNPGFDKSLLDVFNQKIVDTIVPAEGEIAEKGFNYVATLDLSNLPFTLTATEAFDGFEVAASESGAFEIVMPYAPSEKAKGFAKFTLTGSGKSNYMIGPSVDRQLAVILVVPETLEFTCETAINGGEWKPGITGSLNVLFDKADPDQHFVNLVHDGWTITGSLSTDFSENPKLAADATDLDFAIIQDPAESNAIVRVSYTHNDREIFDIAADIESTGEIMDMSTLTAFSSLQDVVGLIASTRGTRNISLTLFGALGLDIEAGDATKMLEVTRGLVTARRHNADYATIDAFTQQLNGLVTAKMVLRGADMEPMPVTFVTVPFGVTYTATPAITFPDSETPVPIFTLFSDDAKAYAMNIIDQAAEPALGSVTAVRQVMVYLSSLLAERFNAESVLPPTISEAVADHLKQLLKASALNTNFTSWERINSLNEYFNENILNNPEFDKTVLEIFNRKIMETVAPAEGEVAAKGFAYNALVDVYDIPYTLTARDDFSGFDVTPSESGKFEMVTPFKPSEKASGKVKVTIEGSGDPTLLFGPSSRNKELAIVLIVPAKAEFTIASAMNGKDWHVDVSGSIESKFVKSNPDSEFVSLATDSWTVSGSLATSFVANPRYPKDDATTMNFEIVQDVANNVGNFKFTYNHNGRPVIDLDTVTTATGQYLDLSSISALTSLNDIVGMLAATHGARQLSLTLYDRVGFELSSGNSTKLLEVVTSIAEERKHNADYETIDALTQQLNGLVTVKMTFKAAKMEMPVTFVTVPFGVTYTTVPAVIFPDDETPVPFAALFDAEAQSYVMNILDQALTPASGSVTTVKELAVAFRSLTQSYDVNASIEDIEDIVYGSWNVNMAVTLPGEVLNSEDDSVAGVVQLKVGKPTKKGTVKVSGNVTLMDGKKYTIKPTVVALPDSGPLMLNSIEVNKLGKLTAKVGANGFKGAIGDAYTVGDAEVGGAWTDADSTVEVDFTTGVALPDGMTAESTALLPVAEPIILNKGKWTFNKAATVKAVNGVVTADVSNGKTNLSAMKLTYKPKTGLFKGSFKIYTLNNGRLKKIAVKVSGVVVDGVGYGITTLDKTPAGWTVTID